MLKNKMQRKWLDLNDLTSNSGIGQHLIRQVEGSAQGRPTEGSLGRRRAGKKVSAKARLRRVRPGLVPRPSEQATQRLAETAARSGREDARGGRLAAAH